MKTSGERRREDMYGTAEMPALLPASGALQPRPQLPATPELPSGRPAGHRAPKLGQIGRTKRVVIEDEDLDDIINNNRSFPVCRRVSPVA